MKNPFWAGEDKARPKDIIPAYSFPEFPVKKGEDLRAYLNRVSKFAEWRTQEAIEWYIRKKNPMRRNAQALRFLSIMFVAFGGLTPFIVTGKLLPETVNWTEIGYVSFVLAATCVGLDRVFGYSSSWMRFIMTELRLQMYLAEFQHDWAIQCSKAAGDKFDCNVCENMLRQVQIFRLKVLSELEKEAADWATDYRSNLGEMEKSIRQQLERLKSGGE